MHPSTQPAERSQSARDVLVADDDVTVRRLLTRVLSGRGHRIHEAPDAPAAIELARSRRLDVALLDERMPGGGRSVIAALVQARFAGVVVLMGGALTTEDPVPTGVHLLKKPFDLNTLIALVEGQATAEPRGG